MRMGTSMIRVRFGAALGLVIALAPSHASAQQVVSVREGVNVHRDPDPNSPVVAILAEAVVLEWVGESGDYYSVVVPGEPSVTGWVLAADVQVRESALDDPLDPLAPGGGGAPVVVGDIPTLQAQYDRAQARSERGLATALSGGALAAASALFFSIFEKPGDVDDYDDPYTRLAVAEARLESADEVKNIAMVAGTAIAAFGAAQFFLGRRTMGELELDMPRQAEATMQEQYEAATRRRAAGRTRMIAGASLVVAAQAVVGFVPQFAEPVLEDYDSSIEYDNAVSRRNAATTVRTWSTVAGALLASWGGFDWFIGQRDMSRIEEGARTSAADGPRLFVDVVQGNPAVGVGWVW